MPIEATWETDNIEAEQPVLFDVEALGTRRKTKKKSVLESTDVIR